MVRTGGNNDQSYKNNTSVDCPQIMSTHHENKRCRVASNPNLLNNYPIYLNSLNKTLFFTWLVSSAHGDRSVLRLPDISSVKKHDLAYNHTHVVSLCLHSVCPHTHIKKKHCVSHKRPILQHSVISFQTDVMLTQIIVSYVSSIVLPIPSSVLSVNL